jgi:hypothetical protein
MYQLPLENFENNRVEFCFVKILLLSLSAKNLSLVGRMLDYGKKGEFLNSSSIYLEIPLSMPQQVCLT